MLAQSIQTTQTTLVTRNLSAFFWMRVLMNIRKYPLRYNFFKLFTINSLYNVNTESTLHIVRNSSQRKQLVTTYRALIVYSHMHGTILQYIVDIKPARSSSRNQHILFGGSAPQRASPTHLFCTHAALRTSNIQDVHRRRRPCRQRWSSHSPVCAQIASRPSCPFHMPQWSFLRPTQHLWSADTANTRDVLRVQHTH